MKPNPDERCKARGRPYGAYIIYWCLQKMIFSSVIAANGKSTFSAGEGSKKRGILSDTA